MYKRHIFLAIIVFAISTIVSFIEELRLNPNFVNNLITFFSIVFGFYLTALSILYGSNFTKRLAKEEDVIKKNQTKLHTLKAYFHFSSLVSICSIVMLLLLGLLGMVEDKSHVITTNCSDIFSISICWQELLTAASLGLAAINILFMSLLFRIFFNAFTEEGGGHA